MLRRYFSALSGILRLRQSVQCLPYSVGMLVVAVALLNSTRLTLQWTRTRSGQASLLVLACMRLGLVWPMVRQSLRVLMPLKCFGKCWCRVASRMGVNVLSWLMQPLKKWSRSLRMLSEMLLPRTAWLQSGLMPRLHTVRLFLRSTEQMPSTMLLLQMRMVTQVRVS